MNSKTFIIAAAIACVGLSGCASMSAEECMAMDWMAIGYEDGSRGYTADRLGSHRKSCGKHGVTPEFAAYQQGHAQGVEDFCQPGRAFKHGEHGAYYSGVCPAVLEPAFLEAYNAGHKLYSLRSSLNAANSMIYSKERELENAQKRIVQAQVELISDEATAEQRILLINELKDLAEHMGELETEIDQLTVDRARIEQELQLYESSLTAQRD